MRSPPILAVFLVATSAAAQIGNPAGVAPGTQEAAPGVPTPHQTNTEDRLFVRLLAAGGMAEVDFARLAEGKARSQPVQDFARRMVADHTKANRELEGLARAAQIPLPSQLDPEHSSMRSTLESVSAEAFDLAYMQGQVVDHQKVVVLLTWEVGQGQDATLQQWAAATLPVVLGHLELAKALVAELSEQGGRVSMRIPAERAPSAHQGLERPK
jgi:putative membrane protein